MKEARDQITVSVVMAVYNGERFLKEQLRSLMDQTSLPDELIVIDDASSDESSRVIGETLQEARFPWRLIRHDANLQVTRTFEEGFRLAEGGWVMFCDQDDVWEKEKVALFREQAALHPDASMVFSDCMLTDAALCVTHPSMYRRYGFPGITGEAVRVIGSEEGCGIFMKQGWVPGMCLMVRKKAVPHACPFTELTFFDQWLIWNCVIAGDAVFLDRPLVRYRQHGGNVVGVKEEKRRSLKGLRTWYCTKRQADKRHMADKMACMYRLARRYGNQEACSLLKGAAGFARWRLDFSCGKGRLPLAQFLIRAGRGDYQKYLSSVRDNMLKDLGEILFFPYAGRRFREGAEEKKA